MSAQQAANQLLDKYKPLELWSPTTSSLASITWQDEVFLKDFSPKVAWERPSASNIQVAALYFLDAYVGHDNGKPMKAAVWSLLYGMTLLNTDEYFVHDLLGGNEIPSVTHNSGPQPQYQTLADIPDASGSMIEGLHYTSADLKTWYSQVKKAIEDESAVAINYIAFIAATCIRLITKEDLSVATHLMNYTNKNFQSIWSLSPPTDKCPPPPSLNFFSIWHASFPRSEPESRRLLTIMIHVGILKPDGSSTRMGIANASCLLCLRYTGMGCYAYTMSASRALNCTPMHLIKHTLTTNSLQVITAVLEVMQNYEDPKQRQITFPWARLLSEGAFQEVSAKANPEYCYLMIVLSNACRAVTGLKQVTLSEQLMRQQEYKAQLIEDAIRGVSRDEGLTREAKIVQEQFKQGESSQVAAPPAPRSGYSPEEY